MSLSFFSSFKFRISLDYAEVYIDPPTWLPKQAQGTSSVSSPDPLTTTDGDSPAMTYVERLQHVEEELFLVRKEHAGTLKELANVREHVGSLTIIVKELRRLVATNLGVSQEMQDTPSNSPGT